MAAPEEIERILDDVSSALELSSAGRRKLYNYWETNFGDHFRDFDQAWVGIRALVGGQLPILAKQWLEHSPRRVPARARVRSSQLFVFEIMIKWLSVASGKPHHHLLVPQLTKPISPSDYDVIHDFAAEQFAMREVAHLAPREFFVTWTDPHKVDDEDAETRMVLNEVSSTLMGVSKELAASNEKIEKTLAKMDSLEARN
ncbi:hypothetical protein JQ628_20895 [Bradyrhizobium lablabi]|uniref:hypothetical protein n=1 Tax=Bradyrhizobium lablabi TaxID=722472 RepID=UPI001BA58F8F|nr:hypothetical protein [Bradyrhizobium lablabi]MBR1123999.1 hypothetical protein [Bradyrhizobium lablabi]